MISRRTSGDWARVCAALVALPAWAKPKSVLAMIDTDNDGTIDLAEAKKAASALFDRLDPDRDGTLDRRELRGRLSAKGTCRGRSRQGWHADQGRIPQRRRAALQGAADPDNDGTLDAKELRSKAGKALLRLMM